MEAQNNEHKTWVSSLFKSAPGNFSLYEAKIDESSFLYDMKNIEWAPILRGNIEKI